MFKEVTHAYVYLVYPDLIYNAHWPNSRFYILISLLIDTRSCRIQTTGGSIIQTERTG